MIQLLHTPEGVRDIYGKDCDDKVMLERRITDCMHRYGYRSIQTPTFEYFDIFNKERGTVPSKDMYKFFDREGNTLVLRPDMTPSMARCVAKYYRDITQPIRLCYSGNTFLNNSEYQGRLKETTQLGVELFNDESILADADMIALTVNCILEAGITDFQIEIGNADFFKGLIEETGFSEEEQEELRILIKNKNLFGAQDLLSEKNIDNNLKAIFMKMPELFGTIEKISEIRSMTNNARAIAALERMEHLYDLLCVYGYERYVSFDLGMLSKYKYYTGIIFRAITYGTGEAIASGGRYDNLVSQFGVDMPAIGMSLTTDSLLLALERQGLAGDEAKTLTLIAYDKKDYVLAITKAAELRARGDNVAFFPKEEYMDIRSLLETAPKNVHRVLDILDEDRISVYML